MNVFIWTLQIVLAAAFLAAGTIALVRSKSALAESGLAVVEVFSAPTIKTVGAFEVLGAVGIIVPAVTGIAPVLTPVAALGLAVIMAGAVVLHAKRGESFIPALALGVVSLFVAVFRFGPSPL